jgi:hypothetical protein
VRTKEKSISLPATPQQHTPEAPQFHAQRVGNAGGELCGKGGQRAVEGSVMTLEQLGSCPNGRPLTNQAFAVLCINRHHWSVRM